MACLKLMGGYCFLKTKNGKRSLMEEVSLTMDDIDHVDEVQINGLQIGYEYFKNMLKLDSFAFNMECCQNVKDFLILTKLDFEQERYIKRILYGKEFENMDCPVVTKNYLRSITLSQMFKDEFTFVGMDLKYIPCSSKHSEKRHSLNMVVPPCKLAKMRLIMTAFIHNQLEHVKAFKEVYNSEFHDQIGNKVFFHDRLIERVKMTLTSCLNGFL